ncbi:MAG: crotonase [Acidimicrobiia bacterium]|nr:MAG: crotonase [Acidimicrobiia bacterium]
MYEHFQISHPSERVALVTMNRPAKLNAMNREFFRELMAVMDQLDSLSVGAAVITGAGRAFSAGGDIGSFAELGDIRAYRAHLRLVYEAFHRVEKADAPVIAAVNGIAYGGGTELVLACDLAVASREARFAFKEPTVGLMPGYGVIRGPEVIGKRATRLLALTGRDVDALGAKELGLVDEVVAPDELLSFALALGEEIAAQPPLAVRVAKQFINRHQDVPGLPESIEATALLFTTDDHKTAVARFLTRKQ